MALFNLFSWSKKMEEGTAAACARPAERRTNRKKHLRHVHSLRSGGQVAQVTTVM